MNRLDAYDTETYPLSVQQARVWRDREAGTAFVARAEWRLYGALDPERLRNALNQVAQRHAILRTRWRDAYDGSLPTQCFPQQAGPAFELRDLRATASGTAEAALAELFAQAAHAACARDTPAVLQVRLARLGATEHALLLCLPSACADATTLRQVMDEIACVYEGAAPATEPAQYLQYAQWQRELLENGDQGWETEHWRQPGLYAGLDASLPYERRAARSARAMRTTERTGLDRSVTERIRALAARQDVDPGLILATVWAILLARLTRRPQLTLGYAVDGRRFEELRAVPGPFTRFVPLPCKLQDDYQFEEALQRLAKAAADATEAQDYLADGGQCGQPGVFPFGFEYQQRVARTAPASGFSFAERHADALSECFSAKLTCLDDETGISFWFDYDGARLDRSAVDVLKEQLETLLDQAVAAPGAEIARLDMLGARERHRLLHALNATGRELGPAVCAHALFEAQAARTPDATAVSSMDRSLTYAELDARANQLARYLRRHGAGSDEVVAICMDRSPELAIAMLGVLKAGAAYLPIDPAYPPQRRNHLLAATQARMLLADAQVLAAWTPDELPALALDTGWALVGAESRAPAGAEVASGNLAYVIFTSGSTGEPKGVMIEHGGLVNYLHWCRLAYPLEQGAEVPVHSSIAFDLTVTSLLAPLTTGRAVRMLPESLGLAGLVDAVAAGTPISLIKITPAHAQWLGERLTAQGSGKVGALVIGGENLLPEHVAAWRRHTPDVRVFNEYGPTETVVGCCVYEVPPDTAGFEGALPIGRPIFNTRLYVLDAELRPVATGMTGELYIGGAGVARGYMGRPDLTAERFLDDPFLDGHQQARMYKTGDLARHLPDGSLELIGRTDQQVKIRGYRIELGEIEAVLAQQPGVEAAAALAQEDSDGDKRLVAYVVATKPVTDALRDALFAILPAHMVPSRFVRLERLPLTGNGKVDRLALAAAGEGHVRVRAYLPPQGAGEQLLAELWQELLGVAQVGRDDNFFELGGHSFLLVTMLDRLRARQLDVPVRAAFAAPDLAALAAALTPAGAATLAGVAPAAVPAGCERILPSMLDLVDLEQAQIDQIAAGVAGGAANIQDIYPLAPLQEGILFHHRMVDGADPYVARALFECTDRATVDRFLQAIERVVARHDILRTAFWWDGLARPVQVVVRDSGGLLLEQLDLDGAHDSAARFAALTDPALHRLDARRATLMKACIAQAPGGHWHVALLFHHLVCDHVSLDILVGEIEAMLGDTAAALAPAASYRAFIAQLRQPRGDDAEAYFRSLLGDVTWPTTAFGARQVTHDGTAIAEYRAPLEPSLAGRVRSAARRQGVAPAVLFHAVWALVLARCCGRDDVVFGTLLSGRSGASLAGRAIGMYINTLPIRVSLGQCSADELIAAVAGRLSELLEHEQADLSLAQRCSAVDAGAPLFTSLLNYRHSGDRSAQRAHSLAAAGIRLTGGEERTSYPLTLTIDDTGAAGFSVKVQCTAEADPALVAAMTVRGLEALIDAIDDAARLPAARLDVLPGEAHARALAAFRGPQLPMPPGALAHELFAAQAAARPDAVAVIHDSRRITYADLERKAERIACALDRIGVKRDDRVALCVGRGIEMVAALLGILKAGAAYVPLDPAFPTQRLAYMFGDCAAAALLTERALQPALDAWDLSGTPVLVLDALEDDACTAVPALPGSRPQAGARDLAYVLYTSGSSGQPKGVMVEHGALANFIQAMTRTAGIARSDVMLACTTLSFDIAALELFVPLANGATVVVGERPDATDPARLAEAVARHGVTVLQATPSSWSMLIDAGWKGEPGLRALCGGEALPVALARQLAERCAGVLNLYGPTETTVWSTWHKVSAAPAAPGGYELIGRPIDNTQLYVLDTHLRPVPPGVTGELCIGGAGLARGYLNRPALSAERFVTVALEGSGAPVRLYRTGDLARQRPDGGLEYLGRSDAQLKIRGHRIEPGEIEAQLNACPDVAQSAVVAHGVSTGAARLVAYIVARAGLAPSTGVLRVHLAAHLPEHMIPAAFVTLDSFPLTPNGKLDRSALPAPGQEAFATAGFEKPTGEIETALAREWQELLGVARIGRKDHFFDLGGHSLLATQLVLRVETTCGVTVQLKDIFERPVLADFAAVVFQRQMDLFTESEIESMQQQLDALSPEELLALLNDGGANE
jgi:amino acid adenylation domain-containing protein